MKVLVMALAVVAITLNLGGCKSMKNTTETHNSQNSLDWDGIYKGMVLSTTGENSIVLELQKDMSYTMQVAEDNFNKMTESNGTFAWKGNEITLKDAKTGNQTVFFVGENMLTRKGNKGMGLNAQYTLNKVQKEGITEKYWKLIEVNGKPVVKDANLNKEPYMILKNEDHRVIGTGGCNSFTGAYELGAMGRIKFSQVAGTMMACMNMEVETALYRALEMADNYTVSADGKYLSLNKARMAPLARFEVVYLR